MAAGRSYTPEAASLDAYKDMLRSLGIARGVLVQPSFYGTDNGCLMEALARDPVSLRGVAVVGPDVTDRELEDLAAGGIRGIRLNAVFAAGVPLAEVERLAHRVAPLGWHIQFLIDGRILEELGPRLAALPVQLVFDHLGHIPSADGVRHPGFLQMTRLMRDGRAYAKLSGAYRVSAEGAPFRDTDEMARALVAAAPDRCLWGSDWPHVGIARDKPVTADLLDILMRWVPDETTRRRILVDNPAHLYGFGGG